MALSLGNSSLAAGGGAVERYGRDAATEDRAAPQGALVSRAEGAGLEDPAARPVLGASKSARAQGLSKDDASAGGQTQSGADDLTPEEEAVVEQLKERDREVRDHEEAHARVGGQYAGSPSYEYQVGPDGKRYAVGGSVSIDVSAIPDDPAATIQKMRQVKAAALAPAEPSAADRQVAATADRQRAQAQAELLQQRSDERLGLSEGAEETAGLAASGYARALDAQQGGGGAASYGV